MEGKWGTSAVSIGCLFEGRIKEKACRSKGWSANGEKRGHTTLNQSHRSGSPGTLRQYSLYFEESPAARDRQTDRQMDRQIARMSTASYGQTGSLDNVWERPQGAKGLVLMELGMIIICHLSWEEPTVTLPCPRHSGRMSYGMHC